MAVGPHLAPLTFLNPHYSPGGESQKWLTLLSMTCVMKVDVRYLVRRSDRFYPTLRLQLDAAHFRPILLQTLDVH